MDIDITTDLDTDIRAAVQRAHAELRALPPSTYDAQAAALRGARERLAHCERQIGAHVAAGEPVRQAHKQAQRAYADARRTSGGQRTPELDRAQTELQIAARASERQGHRLVALQGSRDTAELSVRRAESELVQTVRRAIEAERDRRRKRLERVSRVDVQAVLALVEGADQAEILQDAQQRALELHDEEEVRPIPPPEPPRMTLAEQLRAAASDDDDDEPEPSLAAELAAAE